MARRQLACGLVLVGLFLCGCAKEDSSGDKQAAPAASQPAADVEPADGE